MNRSGQHVCPPGFIWFAARACAEEEEGSLSESDSLRGGVVALIFSTTTKKTQKNAQWPVLLCRKFT